MSSETLRNTLLPASEGTEQGKDAVRCEPTLTDGQQSTTLESTSDFAIRVRNLSKCYQIYDTPRDRLKQFFSPRLRRLVGLPPKHYFREFWALKDISFEINKGETVGIIGRNGSGKSTLLQIICGTLTPTGGLVETNGRIAALLELGSGFNPEFTGRENVYMNATLLGMDREDIDARFDEIAAFADIGEFIEQPVKTYSSGMVIRLAFAVSVCIEPHILVVDEAIAVGDAAFQQRCLQRLADMREKGTTILVVTHDIMLTRNYCGRVIYLNQGIIKQIGDPEVVGEIYLKELFASQRHSREVDQIEWRSGPGKLGFGSARGQITYVTLRGQNSSGIFRLGEMVGVVINAQVAADVTYPEIIIQVRDSRGYVLYGIRTLSHELKKSYVGNLVVISAAADFIADLAPGEYAITIGLNERNGDSLITLLDKAVAAVVFSVISDDHRFHGCIDLHGRWQNPGKI